MGWQKHETPLRVSRSQYRSDFGRFLPETFHKPRLGVEAIGYLRLRMATGPGGNAAGSRETERSLPAEAG